MTYDGFLTCKCIQDLDMYMYVRIYYMSQFVIGALTLVLFGIQVDLNQSRFDMW